ncbi:MAG TPA: alpha/beta fold hydrolase [Ohtaekwangia sp.]
MKESIRVIARDGLQLSATWFIADNPQEKVILINSATGVKQQFYHDFASYLAKQGFNTYTFDYRGIGESKPEDLSSLLCDMKDWSKDVDAMIAHIGRVHSQAKLFILGHSVGGQLIGMSSLVKRAEALVMIGSQTPYWRNYKGAWMKFKLLFFWYILIPFSTGLFQYFPASKLRMFEDLPGNVARQWARWAKSSDYIFKELPALRSSFKSLEQPTLLVSFTDDELAPHRAVMDLRKYYSQLKIDHWHLHPEDVLQKKIGHFGFFKKRMEPLAWKEVVSWILKNTASPKYKAA